jgi:hypothetical protein
MFNLRPNVLKHRSNLNLTHQVSILSKLRQLEAMLTQATQRMYALIAKPPLIKALFTYVLSLANVKVLLNKRANSPYIAKSKGYDSRAGKISNIIQSVLISRHSTCVTFLTFSIEALNFFCSRLN